METNYNSNIYLSTSTMNEVENKIEEVINNIQYNLFDGVNSPLKSIDVGDNLNGKTLYLSFPRDSYTHIENTTKNIIITIDSETRIAYMYSNSRHYIYVRYKGTSYYLYAKNDSGAYPYLNYVRFKLPYDFGTVTSINNSDYFYNYIKIYDNENIIPNHNKHTWVDNEVLSMQKIDNIENSIKNIGEYYYKPTRFINTREWLGTPELLGNRSSYYGTNIQNISYIDLNRWMTNLNLINFNNLDKLTIWNTKLSQIYWNEDNDVEWEDY